MYSLSLKNVVDLLKKDGLFREIVHNGEWHYRLPDTVSATEDFTHVSYNSQDTQPNTLFFCKGARFEQRYLEDAIEKGAAAYVSEVLYEDVAVPGIIVSDIRKTMALLAREFYGNPQNQMTMVGITGTKGKTTTTYYVKDMLDRAYPGKNGMISTINATLDGETSTPSSLTTPESLDLFKMLATAAENGMDRLVMEVSSQAYKLHRVYGMDFDIGVFMNISPDHLGPNEHPTHEDYFYCKRQLLAHSKQAILFNGTDHFQLLKEFTDEHCESVLLFGQDTPEADYYIEAESEDPLEFSVKTRKEDTQNLSDDYRLNIPGDFNRENALAAMLVVSLLGVEKEVIKESLSIVTVPGRMERFTQKNGSTVYVDFAHNYISLSSLLEYAEKEHPDGEVTLIIGAPGGKGYSRRKDFGTVLSKLGDRVILTEEDPNFDDPREVSEEIASYIEGDIKIEYVDDRKEAIHHALSTAKPKDVVVIAGKGDDDFQIVEGKNVPYESDIVIVKNYIEQSK